MPPTDINPGFQGKARSAGNIPEGALSPPEELTLLEEVSLPDEPPPQADSARAVTPTTHHNNCLDSMRTR
jgi:hypothetical protein